MDRDDWNRRYAGSELLWSAEPNRFLVEEVSDLEPGDALDLACGEGRNAVWLAGRGWRVRAVDFSPVGLEKARTLATGRRVAVDWVQADVTEYRSAPAIFDLVIVFYLQLPKEGMRRALSLAADAVAPGGTFLLVGHDRTNLERGHGGPRDPAVLYTPEEIASGLGALRVVEAARRNRPVQTDTGERIAIDCLVRAVRDQGAGSSSR